MPIIRTVHDHYRNHVVRAAGTAAGTAGLIFVGVQINHPYLGAASITTTGA